jgi:hypothetical protein
MNHGSENLEKVAPNRRVGEAWALVKRDAIVARQSGVEPDRIVVIPSRKGCQDEADDETGCQWNQRELQIRCSRSQHLESSEIRSLTNA